MKFIGRDSEINIIKSQLDNKKFSSILLYGRRRVGKTELIGHCLKNRKEKILYFTAEKINYTENLELFLNYVSSSYSISYSFNTFESALDYISERSHKEKTILVIDEYSYFRNGNNRMDSIIQKFIDSNSGNRNLKLILSGSLIEIMKSITESNEPLYGRFTAIIDLKPFSYLEVANYFKEKSDEEKLMIYAVFGGVPHYLGLIDKSLSIEENIIHLFYSKNAVMESEIEILLNGELSKIELANTVLSIIKNGTKSYTDINQKLSSKHSGNGATYILNKLCDIGVLDKEIIINQKDHKKGLYYICDNALLFYYTYIMPYKNQMRLLSPEGFYQKFIKEELKKNYIPRQFEMVCKEYLIEMNKRNKLEVPFYEIGKLTYHDKKENINREFDIVTKDDNGYIYYECKYYQNKVNNKDIEAEIKQANSSKLKFYKFGFFSRRGFEKSVGGKTYILFTLKDIFNLE